ncbi:NADH-ubiquinone oxidoreductase ASHI subunit (CI-ASHI or NDUFB8) domain-containing protein [Trichoderma breve]|uniref:NADH-ubiquinone oxidoreductase ASHI subunit (CI-ASHI or NDUFB8) domain-containing protein n=1 Tax=Trichoderma breve TaxID=2034170 RepID=A0A9W9B735_9HYPO|nr:NADH-ubiquinone oxidoreductase ASHI subunit (CI-ASHI or NDUFB8) domain-containing protein [Trichoderma breve]KAJ4855000.1 NADH-ubiquinone oxidoreductase ASHI subunit (CI-ASHI or NDUFB8) domain-containing protein [Trichoderma breve]
MVPKVVRKWEQRALEGLQYIPDTRGTHDCRGHYTESNPVTQQLGAEATVNPPKMLPQRVVRASALRNAMAASRRLPTIQRRGFLPSQFSDKKVIDEKYPDFPRLSEAQDPGMNGGYINPPRIKRQFRDPYATWWDPQERRNFGEPVHEDNDMMGIFSPWEYTWTTTGPGLIMVGTFIAVFLGVSGVVYLNYPDRVAFPREFENGLERELGGPGAVRARMAGDEDP